MLGTYTHHARARMQQRGIRTEALEALFEYGRSAPAGRGCEVLFIDKLVTACHRGCWRVVGHRYRRVPRG